MEQEKAKKEGGSTMAEKLDQRETVSFEELLMSNVYTQRFHGELGRSYTGTLCSTRVDT